MGHNAQCRVRLWKLIPELNSKPLWRLAWRSWVASRSLRIIYWQDFSLYMQLPLGVLLTIFSSFSSLNTQLTLPRDLKTSMKVGLEVVGAPMRLWTVFPTIIPVSNAITPWSVINYIFLPQYSLETSRPLWRFAWWFWGASRCLRVNYRQDFSLYKQLPLGVLLTIFSIFSSLNTQPTLPRDLTTFVGFGLEVVGTPMRLWTVFPTIIPVSKCNYPLECH